MNLMQRPRRGDVSAEEESGSPGRDAFAGNASASFFSASPPAVQAILIVMLVFSLARYAVDGFGLEIMGRSLSQGGDFQAYYMAGYLLRAGENLYDYERFRELQQNDPALRELASPAYLYPPLIAVMMTPLSGLHFQTAYRIWVIGEQLCLAVALYLLARNLPFLGKSLWPLLVMVILAANMFPVYLAVDLGQVNILVLLCLALAIHFMRARQFLWAGVAVGVGAMIKVTPLIFLGFFVLQREWRGLAGVFVTLAILAAFIAVIAGPQSLISFVEISVGSSIPDYGDSPANLSPAGFIHRLLAPLGAPTLETLARWGLILLTLGVLAWLSLKKYPEAGLSYTLLVNLWITAILLVSPLSWEHHLVWLLPALGAAVSALVYTRKRSWLWFLWFGLVYAALAFENIPLNRSGQWAFQSGWWIFSGDYLRQSFVADVRLLATAGLFALLIVLLRNVGAAQTAVAVEGEA